MGACPACGETNPPESRTCASCGEVLGAPGSSSPFAAFAQFDTPHGPDGDATFGPPATPPGPPPAPLAIPTTTSTTARNILVGVVLVVVLAAVAFVVLGSADDDEAATVDASTTTLTPVVTAPELADEELLTDVLAVEGRSSPLGGTSEDTCFYRSMIAAMGGAGRLREAIISPEQLAGTFPLRGEVVPADAVDVFLATNAACGVDLTEEIVVRPLRLESAELAACVGAGIDRTTLNRLIATFFLDPNRSDFTFVVPADLALENARLVTGCE